MNRKQKRRMIERENRERKEKKNRCQTQRTHIDINTNDLVAVLPLVSQFFCLLSIKQKKGGKSVESESIPIYLTSQTEAATFYVEVERKKKMFETWQKYSIRS